MINKQIKSALINSSSSLSFHQYAPRQYKDKQHEYLHDGTRTFQQEYAKYSSDYVEAEVQGLDPEFPFEYTTVHVRFANVIKPSGALSNLFDNYKNILIAERPYAYIRRGAKVKAMGSTWLVKNPNNESEGSTAIIQKCDAVWNYLDYYGNVCSEPMCIDRDLMRANTPDSQRSTMVTKGYFNAIIQRNEATKQLFHNTRMILGTSAFVLTGFSDFIREFTEEEESVNLLEFSLRYDEPNDALDDMVNHVAGGKKFYWDINISGDSTITAGETATYIASSVRSNAGTTEAVSSTEEHPIDYLWSSSDESIATIDENGTVTGISEGKVTITATLAQNPNNTQNFEILIASVDTTPHVEFDGTYPEMLPCYQSVTFKATYYEEGKATSETVTWKVSGADEESYSLNIDGNYATLKCWRGSINPAIVTATYGEHSASYSIELMGI